MFINSENARGRRPVTGHNSRKDPTTPDYQSDGGTMTEAEILGLIRRDGIQLNGVDMRNIRTRVLELLAYRRRVEMYREKEKITYHWKKPERLRR
ncbi:hypothetical protein [Escherichia coli]